MQTWFRSRRETDARILLSHVEAVGFVWSFPMHVPVSLMAKLAFHLLVKVKRNGNGSPSLSYQYLSLSAPQFLAWPRGAGRRIPL